MTDFDPSDDAAEHGSEGATEPSAVPGGPGAGGRPGGRGALLMAVALVAVLGGAVLFGAGFLLGRQEAQRPGTSADRQQLFEPFWDAYDAIAREYVGGADEKKLVEGAIKGMFDAIGDRFSRYLTSEEYRDSISGISGEFEGIGAIMTTRNDTDEEGCEKAGPECHIVVVKTIRGSPALAAGLQKDDEVVAIDGASVAGKTLAETVDVVRGPRGTTVTLTILRGPGEPFELAVERAVIQVEAVSSEVMAGGMVGYIRLDGFSSSAAGDFRGHLKGLIDQGLTRIVFDLRGDSGGFVDAAEKIASEFIASGPVFWEEFANGTQQAHEAIPGGVATDPRIRVLVLIDGGSASASEIVAGALQDTGRAQLVGQKSFGKGTIQQWHTLSNDSGAFQLSVAKWLTPDKRWIHEVGLVPDVSLGVAPDAPGDVVLEKAIEILTGSSATLDGLPRAA